MRNLGSDASRRRQEAWQRRARGLRGKVFKLCELRHGSRFIPNNEDGRKLLTALLWLGLAAEKATLQASWCEPELRKLQRAARRVKWEDLGELIGLSYEEREQLKAWSFWPHDVPQEEVRRRQAEKNRKNARERSRRRRERERDKREQQRERQAMIINASKRDTAILRMLDTQRWTPISELVGQAFTCRAFRRPDDWSIRRSGMRKLMHRAVEQLVEHGLVETKLVPGMRGMVRMVRKFDVAELMNEDGPAGAERDGVCHGDNVTPFPATGKMQKSPLKQGLGA
jgi:hypothetical protein